MSGMSLLSVVKSRGARTAFAESGVVSSVHVTATGSGAIIVESLVRDKDGDSEIPDDAAEEWEGRGFRYLTLHRHHQNEIFPRLCSANLTLGWGSSSVGTTSSRHAAEAGSIPRCGMRFFSKRQLSVQTLLRCPYTPVCNRVH